MAELTAKKRAKIPPSQFALPKEGKFPIHDPPHIRAAASRLEGEKNKGAITGAKYEGAKKKIAAAAKKAGIESKYHEKEKDKGEKEKDKGGKKG